MPFKKRIRTGWGDSVLGSGSYPGLNSPTTKRLLINPSTAVADCILWLAADKMVADGNATNDGDAVGTWTDHSGGSRDATQATAGFKPLYKTAIQHGYPAVRFQGTDDFLQIADNNVWSPVVNDMTAFVVYKPANLDTNQQVIGKGGASSYEWAMFFTTTGILSATTYQVGGAGNMVANSSAGVVTTSAFEIDTFWVDYNVEIRNYHNGGAKVTSSSVTGGSTNGTNLVEIGARADSALYFTGDILEIVVYNRALTNAELNLVNSYLGAKYALNVTPVS